MKKHANSNKLQFDELSIERRDIRNLRQAHLAAHQRDIAPGYGEL
jgi:hypothetical protein